jgi:mannobiose 2-epimerase
VRSRPGAYRRCSKLALASALALAACEGGQPRATPARSPDAVAVAAPADERATPRRSEHADAKLDARLERIRARLSVLAADSVRFWREHGVDRELGGFHGTLSRRGDPVAPTDKSLVQQARHTWTFSMWYERREPVVAVREIADHGYRFLAHFRDERDGEFVYKVSREGKLVDPKKQLYPESFAIYALAEYGRVFSHHEALAQAMKCFRAIDGRAHDAEYGGYDQRNDPGWLAPGAEKGTNTHIHLLESFTELYRATRDGAVKARLEELIEVVATKIVQPAGYAHKEFERDWTPHAEPVASYGHDLETVWLLIDALDALGRERDEVVVGAARRLGEQAAHDGYDAKLGGYFEEGPPGGAPAKLEKVWWVQAEALAGLWWTYRLTGDASYLDRLEGTLGFIETRQRDPEHGEWFFGVNPDGSLGPRGDNKGEEWKTGYHALRALVFLGDWIRGDWIRGD